MKCEACSDGNVIFDSRSNEYHCDHCGVIVQEIGRSFIVAALAEEDGQAAINPAYINRGLGTLITRVLGLRMFRRSFKNSVERRLNEAFPSLQHAWGYAGITATYLRQDSVLLYRRCLEKGLVKGRRADGMALAAVYIVYTHAGMVKDIAGISQALGLSVDEVYSYSRKIRSKIGYPLKKPSILEHIGTAANSLSISEDLQGKMKYAALKVIEMRLEQGRHAAVVAGAIMYLVSKRYGVDISQKRIAKALKVEERSIRRIYGGM